MKIVNEISDEELLKELTDAIRDFIISLEIKGETDYKYSVLKKKFKDLCCKIFPNAKEPPRIYPMCTV